MDNTSKLDTAAPSQGQAAQDQGSVPTADDALRGAAPEQTPAEGQSAKGDGLILGKFKSVEDLAKSYQDLESHTKKVEQERAQQRAKLDEVFASQPQAQAESPTVVDDDPVVARVSGVVERLLSPVTANIEVTRMHQRYGDDFVKAAEAVKAIKEQRPDLSLEDAYKLASFDRMQKEALENAQKREAAARAEAAQAQVETTRPSGYRPMTVEDAVKDKSVPVEDIAEALGPEYAIFAKKTKELVRNRKI